MTVFHSGHLFYLPKLSGQPYRGQKTLITVNIFSAIFFRRLLFSNDIFRHQPHHQERKEEICNFSQSIGAKKTDPRASPAPFFSGGLNPTRRRVRARGPLSSAELLPLGSSGAVLHF